MVREFMEEEAEPEGEKAEGAEEASSPGTDASSLQAEVSLAELEPLFEADADAGWLLMADAEPRADVRPPILC
jgi:hypothetical protein